jgi:hypothetical protein
MLHLPYKNPSPRLKNSCKGRQEWEFACQEVSLPYESLHLRKLKTFVKTRFASKVVLFQETLEYVHAIMICYSH